VFGFVRAGFDEEPVFDAGLQRAGNRPLGGRSHAPDVQPVGEICDGDGSGIGNQVPDRVRSSARLDVPDRNDLDGSQSELAIEQKNDHFGVLIVRAAEHGPARFDEAMADLNRRGGKSVSIDIKAQAPEQQDDGSKQNVFAGHGSRRLTLINSEQLGPEKSI